MPVSNRRAACRRLEVLERHESGSDQEQRTKLDGSRRSWSWVVNRVLQEIHEKRNKRSRYKRRGYGTRDSTEQRSWHKRRHNRRYKRRSHGTRDGTGDTYKDTDGIWQAHEYTPHVYPDALRHLSPSHRPTRPKANTPRYLSRYTRVPDSGNAFGFR